MTTENMTPTHYALGVLFGMLALRAVAYALKQLWETAKAPGRIRQSEERMVRHLEANYSKRGSLSR